MSAVWVVRDADGRDMGVGTSRTEAIDAADFGRDDDARDALLFEGTNGPYNGFTITRETLLTPEQAAVLEAAGEWDDTWHTASVVDCGENSPRELHAWARHEHAKQALTKALDAARTGAR